MFLLASNFNFRDVAIGTTPMSNIRTPLPSFPVVSMSVRDVAWVLAEVETEAERYLGSFGPREYDALMTVNLPNRGHLNRVWLMPHAHFSVARPHLDR
jgi:hypothetical protein